MKRSPSIRRLTAAAAGTLALLAFVGLAGCTDRDGKQAKEEALQALRQQAGLQSYTFEGRATLQLGETFAIAPGNPLTGALIGSLATSTLGWTGTAAVSPPRLEAKLNIAPKAGAPLPEMPILLKDNKLYLQIPYLNPKNEYLSMDVSRQAPGLAQSSQSFAKLAETLVHGLDAKWFKFEAPTSAESAVGVKAWYTVAFVDSNVKAISDALQRSLTEGAARLQDSGLLPAPQADALKASLSRKQVKVQPPGRIRLAVGPDGFVQELALDLSYVLEEAGQSGPVQSLQLTNKWGHRNESPVFTQDVPAQAKPLDQLLNLFSSPAKPPVK